MRNPAYQKLKDTDSLPSPTQVAMEILRLSSDERTTLDRIVGVVESDPALAGRLLKLVNSPFAGLTRKVASVSVAVRLLGLRTVKNLALSVSLVMNNRNGRCETFDYETFWSDSLARAVAARHITTRLGNFATDESFAIGLLSKVGRLALATVYPKEYSELLNRTATEPQPRLRDMERQAFGIDHNELSADMMADWGLDGIFCEAVRQQDSPEQLIAVPNSARTVQLARIIPLAGSLAAMLVGAQTTDGLNAFASDAEELGITQNGLSELFQAVAHEWKEAGIIFSLPTREVPSLEQILQATSPPRDQPEPFNEASAANPPPTTGLSAIRVLVVEDDGPTRAVITRYLTSAGCRVTTAANGLEALEIDRREPAQMIVTDWLMPHMDGLDLCRRLRANENVGFVYIIVLTALTEKQRIVEALQAGADDCLSKPFTAEELLAHVRAGERIIRLEANLAERSREIGRSNARLALVNEKLRSLATTDELTGLANRRESLARLTEHWALAKRYGEPLSCIVADLDHFKKLNDLYGHAVGDAVLHATAGSLRKSVRAGDIVGRMGGEEFIIVCPKSTAEAACGVAERVRTAIARAAVNTGGVECSVTVSLGVAELKPVMQHPHELLKEADEALYAAKKTGRNRTCGPDHAARNQGKGLVSGANHDLSEAKNAEPLSSDVSHLTSHISRESAMGFPPASAPNEPQPLQRQGDAPPRALIADDDPAIRSLCRRLLEGEGFEVSEAPSGAAALETVLAGSHDVIVLDAEMPQMSGLECARQLKADEATREIPILMVSPTSDSESIEDALACGVDEYITKPFSPREFILRVRSLTRLYQSKNELIWSNATRWEQARTLQILLDLSCSLIGVEVLDEILGRVISAAAALTQCERISVMLPGPDGSALRIAKVIGMDQAIAATVRVPAGRAIAGRVFRSGESIVVNDTTGGPAQIEGTDGGFFVSAPLVSKALRASDRVLGVVNLTGRHGNKPFSASELEAIDLLCNVAASAINDHLSRKSLDNAQDAIVVALATLAEYRDIETGKHLDRVTRYATLLAEELRKLGTMGACIDEAFITNLRRAIPLHDIGKVGVPDEILLKPDRLTADEFELMKRHAEIGARTIRSVRQSMPDVPFLQFAEEIASGHHERWDATGYPRGLKGEKIPLSARIAAVADVYDALTTTRVYKEASTHEEAFDIIRRGSGNHFDPRVVEAFITREADMNRIREELADSPGPCDLVDIFTV